MTADTQRPAAPQRLMNTHEVKNLPSGETFKGIYIVTNSNKKTDKNGRPYWEMTVSDKQGSMPGKVWSDAGWWDRSTSELEAKPDLLSDAQISSIRGCTVGITGKVAEFRGQNQYNFNAISLLNQERFPPTKYLASSEIPLPVLSERFDALVDGCRPEIADFLRHIFDGERGKLFRDLPAAVANHHAYAHGLIEHTVSVAEGARTIAREYRATYPSIDVDVAVAGALLHDIGKIKSYRMAPVPEVTIDGAVLDHIAIGYADFVQAAEEYGLSDDLRLAIGHIMLSHHGQKEFGSPVLPATPEALIVAAADELDFRLFCWKDSIRGMADDQEISAFHFAAQRRFWRAGKSIRTPAETQTPQED